MRVARRKKCRQSLLEKNILTTFFSQLYLCLVSNGLVHTGVAPPPFPFPTQRSSLGGGARGCRGDWHAPRRSSARGADDNGDKGDAQVVVRQARRPPPPNARHPWTAMVTATVGGGGARGRCQDWRARRRSLAGGADYDGNDNNNGDEGDARVVIRPEHRRPPPPACPPLGRRWQQRRRTAGVAQGGVVETGARGVGARPAAPLGRRRCQKRQRCGNVKNNEIERPRGSFLCSVLPHKN